MNNLQTQQTSSPTSVSVDSDVSCVAAAGMGMSDDDDAESLGLAAGGGGTNLFLFFAVCCLSASVTGSLVTSFPLTIDPTSFLGFFFIFYSIHKPCIGVAPLTKLAIALQMPGNSD